MIPGVKLVAETFASLNARLSAERRKKAAEIEASQWRERLAQLVRVHTVGEMSAALAHEITQPLGAIENYALAARRRLGEDVPDLRRVGELLDKVLGQATRAGDVVTRMRGMVQRHELETKEIDIARAISDCVEMVKMDCELRNIDVEVKPVGPLPMVVADEIHLQQVILNLLRNAMDAVQTLPPDARRAIAIDAGLDGNDRIFVDVADRGPGIAEADLERVFESFYYDQTERTGNRPRDLQKADRGPRRYAARRSQPRRWRAVPTDHSGDIDDLTSWPSLPYSSSTTTRRFVIPSRSS